VIIARENFTIICGVNRDHYPVIGSVQAVITDPPYGDEVHDKEKVGRTATGEVDAVPVPFEALTSDDVHFLADYCHDNVVGWALVFCQAEQIPAWRRIMDSYEKIRYFRPMLWIKPDAKPNFRGHGPGVGHETIQAYWCGGGRQSWNAGGKVGIYYHNRSRRQGDRHPTEKPVSLMKDLVRDFTNPGDTILDPFMGCGSTGVAALELGRKFIGIEQNQTYFDEALKRLDEADRPTLFTAAPAKIPTLFGDAAFGSTNTRKRLRREAKEKEDADR
jgi:site-specific DNA-methyltransferase (adenine-specific)